MLQLRATKIALSCCDTKRLCKRAFIQQIVLSKYGHIVFNIFQSVYNAIPYCAIYTVLEVGAERKRQKSLAKSCGVLRSFYSFAYDRDANIYALLTKLVR